jgi:hypothetical protein
MFQSKTVFVLGAGASHEICLPLGSGLAKIISKKLDIRFEDTGTPKSTGGDYSLYGALKQKFPSEIKQYLQAAWMIRDGIHLANSIDDFLDRHASKPHVVKYGKLAIVASILEAERDSKIFTSNLKPRDGDFITKTEQTWYPRLLKLLGAGVASEKLDQLFDNVAFIDFNYDRCLPHYLIEAIQPLYGVDDQRARGVVATAKILHPYGSIGNLAMQGGGGNVPFGELRTDLFEVAERIRLYTEQVKEHDELEAIKLTISEAQRIVFVGFGYHQQNLKIITPKETKITQQILGSACGISNDDCEVLQDLLQPLLKTMAPRLNFSTGRNMTYRDNIKLRSDLKSAALFDEFSRTLMS